MNRLSVGAAGLLLAVSLACLSTTVNAHRRNVEASQAAFTYQSLLDRPLQQRLFFIRTVRDIIKGNGSVQIGFKEKDMDSSVYSRVIFDDQLDKKLEWMETNGETELINAYVKVMYNIFTRLEKNLRTKLVTNEGTKELQLRLNAVDRFLMQYKGYASNSAAFKDNRQVVDDETLVIYDELASGHHKEQGLNQHVHTKTWDHDKWNEVYEALPGTSKYHHTGLNPTEKKHLSKNLQIVDEKAYNEKKHENEMTIAKRAFNAKIEALSQSTTKAGDYFKSHQEAIDKLSVAFAGAHDHHEEHKKKKH